MSSPPASRRCRSTSLTGTAALGVLTSRRGRVLEPLELLCTGLHDAFNGIADFCGLPKLDHSRDAALTSTARRRRHPHGTRGATLAGHAAQSNGGSAG